VYINIGQNKVLRYARRYTCIHYYTRICNRLEWIDWNREKLSVASV